MSGDNKKSIFKQAMVYVSKLISTAIIIVLFLVAAFLIYYVISAKMVKNSEGEFNPMLTLYTIVSGSMEPAIKVYDVILVKRVDDPTTVKVGDVITFISTSTISKDMIVTHRVLEVRNVDGKMEYVTKGDNNPTADGTTAKEDNLIGRTILKIPQLGRLQFFIATKIGWFIVVLIPALAIIIYDVLKLFRIIGVKNTSENMARNKVNVNDVNKKAQDKKIEAVFEKIKKPPKSDDEDEEEKKQEKSKDSSLKNETIEDVIEEETEVEDITEIESEEVVDEITEEKLDETDIEEKDNDKEETIDESSDEIEEISENEPKTNIEEELVEEAQKEDNDKSDTQKYRFFGDDEDLESFVKEEKAKRDTSEETKTKIEGIVTRYYEEVKKETNSKKNNQNNRNNQKKKQQPRNNNKKRNNNNNKKSNSNSSNKKKK